MPNVHEFEDYRKLLRAWMLENPKVRTYGYLAKRTKWTKAFVHQVIGGKKNLKEESARRFCEILQLCDDEVEYFLLLVKYTQTSSSLEKKELRRQLAERRPPIGHAFKPSLYDLIAFPTLEAIFELVQCAGRPVTPRWVADHLIPDIDVEEAQDRLKKLVGMGVLHCHGTTYSLATETLDHVGRIHQLSKQDDNRLKAAVFDAHENRNHLAKEAISLSRTHLPQEVRHFAAITASVPELAIADIKAEIVGFMNRILVAVREDYPSLYGDKDRVMYLNVQLFPATKRLDEQHIDEQ